MPRLPLALDIQVATPTNSGVSAGAKFTFSGWSEIQLAAGAKARAAIAEKVRSIRGSAAGSEQFRTEQAIEGKLQQVRKDHTAAIQHIDDLNASLGRAARAAKNREAVHAVVARANQVLQSGDAGESLSADLGHAAVTAGKTSTLAVAG